MHILVIHLSPGSASTLMWASRCVALQLESLSRQLVGVEHEAAITDRRFGNVIVLLLATRVIE